MPSRFQAHSPEYRCEQSAGPYDSPEFAPRNWPRAQVVSAHLCESRAAAMPEVSDPSALHAVKSPGSRMGSLSTCLLRLTPKPMSPPNTNAEPAIINQCGKSN